MTWAAAASTLAAMLPQLRPLALLLLLVLSSAAGPAADRRPLAASDFDAWSTINTPQLSRDGAWLAYSFMPQDRDGTLVLREVASGREHRIPVGSQPPPPAAAEDNASPETPPQRRNIRIAFAGDGRFAVASTFPSKDDVAAARKAKKKPEEMPRDGLVIVRLDSGEVVRLPDIKGFQVPSKGAAWVAYQREAKPEDRTPAEGAPAPAAPGSDESDEDATATAPRGAGTAGAASPFGTELVLRQLETGAERVFASVTEYSFARDSRTLLYAVSAKGRTANGVYVVTPGDAAEPRALLSGPGRYAKLAWDRPQAQAAFVSDRDTADAKDRARFKLYLWSRGSGEARPVVAADTAGLGAGLVVSNSAAAEFSWDGRKLYVPAGKAPKPARPATEPAPATEDKVSADLWHWRDGQLQPMQKVRANQERNRTYRGVLDLATGRYVQVADETMATASFTDDGLRAIGYDDRAYRPRIDYEGRATDVYLVDAATGNRRKVLTQLRTDSAAALSWSPDGRWAAYYQAKQWHIVDAATGSSRALTDRLRVAFHNEDDDHPAPPVAYGQAGWTKDSASFLAYDRFDVWQLFVDGRPARNLTQGHGRATRTALRVQRIEPVEEGEEVRGIDPAQPLVLRGESEDTRATGFFRTAFTGNAAPERLLWGDRSYRYVGRAQAADALLLTASRFDEYPDVHVTRSSFAEPRKLTDGGAQLAPFAWGTAELMPFRNADGVPLQAVVFKPAGFEPGRKYPAIVYLYERLSQVVHNFVNPAPGTSINVSFYTSNGYVVLMPDIVYQTGRPGESALDCVLPALDALLEKGLVDPRRVGIQGHSWGGYQIAYMLTKTDRFRAAEAGAPVGNMTSAYSGIRWGSGLARQFQYEVGQSRIGKPLGAAAKVYLENSAVFRADQVKTPLLILHNDNDDAVPWYQGIELFLALRRLEKPVWLFNYNGEFHGLRRRANQKDWSRRLHQFFDHYLKDAPAPAWLKEGIPYLEREEEKETFNGRVVLPAAEGKG